MRIDQAVQLRNVYIRGGGPGSGCRGPNCGRPCLTPGCPEHNPRPAGMTEVAQEPARITTTALMRIAGWRSEGPTTLRGRPATVWTHYAHGKMLVSNNWYEHWQNGVKIGEKTDLSTGTPLANKLQTYMQQKGLIVSDVVPDPAPRVPRDPRTARVPRIGTSRQPEGFLTAEIAAGRVPERRDVSVLAGGNAAQIKHLTGLTPEQYTDVLLRDTEGLGITNVSMVFGGYGNNIHYTMNYRVNGSSVSMQRTLDFNKKSVYHALFSMQDEKAQGAGIGKVFFRNSLDLYDHMGMKKVRTTANISVGGYAWAKYGFLPLSWKTLAQRLRWRTGQINDKDQELEVQKLLADPRAKAMWLIADMKRVNRKGMNNRDITVGQEILLGTTWQGQLSLVNREQYTRARVYTAKSNKTKSVGVPAFG